MFLDKNIGKLKDKSKRGFIYTVVFVIIYFLLITAIAPKKHNLEAGDIAPVDIKAPIDTVDEVATKEKEKEAVEKVDKQYTLKGEVKLQAEESITKLFNKLGSEIYAIQEDKEKISLLKKIEGFNFSDEECKTLITLTKDQISEVQWFIIEILDSVYSENIAENNLEHIQRARNIVDTKLSNKNYPRNIEDVIRDIAYSKIKPNFFFDKEKTDEKIKEVQKSIQKEIIKKNQTIVKEGEPITVRQIEILTELGLLDTGVAKNYLFTYIVLGILVALILGLQYSYLARERKDLYYDTKIIVMISITNLITLLFARGLTVISPFLIPIACSAILLTILIDYKVSIVINLLNTLFIAIIVGFNSNLILIAIINIILGSTRLKKIQQRNDVLYSTVYIAMVSCSVAFASGLLMSNNIRKIFLETGYTALGAFLSGVLAVGLLPFFESGFDVVTNIKLLELSNPNHPLMKKLLMEAPGTYHHSMMVANIAEVAAEAVGGNPVVARIGAYYHDIGKTKRPYFFGENQMGKENPHNKITPNLSTLIIISHTKDGVELAKEHNIPKVIQDIIEQHHGTTLVKYFYYTLKNSSDKPEEIKEEDFRYPGPIPSSKEAGIIMLADSVEAAVRSISEPTKGKIEEMVNNIIKDKLYSDQLKNCDLTLKDLEIIRTCFLKSLNGIYHQRIEYPTEKKSKEK
ncbi:HD family phosphohydrolase [Clostridium carnis]